MAKEHAPPGTLTKTSIMLGCGETPEQVISTMEKVRTAGVDVITFGQYMRPSKRHMPVSEYVTPEAFEKYRALGVEMVCPSFPPFSHCMRHLEPATFLCYILYMARLLSTIILNFTMHKKENYSRP